MKRAVLSGVVFLASTFALSLHAAAADPFAPPPENCAAPETGVPPAAPMKSEVVATTAVKIICSTTCNDGSVVSCLGPVPPSFCYIEPAVLVRCGRYIDFCLDAL